MCAIDDFPKVWNISESRVTNKNESFKIKIMTNYTSNKIPSMRTFLYILGIYNKIEEKKASSVIKLS